MGSRIIQGNKRLQAGICFEKHNRLYFNFFFYWYVWYWEKILKKWRLLTWTRVLSFRVRIKIGSWTNFQDVMRWTKHLSKAINKWPTRQIGLDRLLNTTSFLRGGVEVKIWKAVIQWRKDHRTTGPMTGSPTVRSPAAGSLAIGSPSTPAQDNAGTVDSNGNVLVNHR